MNVEKEFTEILNELVVKQGISLTESLEIMSRNRGCNHSDLWGCVSGISKKQSVVQKAALEILGKLKNGMSFSMALKTCNSISFDEIYVAFVAFSEKSGKFEETCKFLLDRCERLSDGFFQIVEACAYPLFVIGLAVIGSIILLVNGKSIIADFGFGNDMSACVYESVFRALVFLAIYFIVTFFVLKNVLGDNRMFESFLAADFLIKSGVNMSEALGSCVSVAGIDSFLGKQFIEVKNHLEKGEGLRTSFEPLMKMKNGWKLESILFLADYADSGSEVFGKLAECIRIEDEKKRKICLMFIEPLFILGTGIFLLILISGIYLPMMQFI